MKDNYAKAYKEVVETLKYMSNEDIEKIPLDMREMFEIKMDKNYKFDIDVLKPFEEQNFMEETKAIFASIFRDYWATNDQREEITVKENLERDILEKEKREKYNPNNIFKK